jgi:two-component system CheB/CheR fusion protein
MSSINKKSEKVKKQHEDPPKPFPVVAIGASAGGIEAITHLFEYLPSNLGMAYVVIQHLSPNHESILPELIERKTKMKVYQVADGMHVAVDSIYVIPPNALMSIVDGKLTLSPHARSDGNIHSIDFFLTALASVYQEKAIAVILSGSANDGTEGVRAIKNSGGITFAQDKSAKFPAMPHNAIDSGFVDNILSLEEIAKELEDLSQNGLKNIFEEESINSNKNELQDIFEMLNTKYNINFSSYKPNTITRRILRRMNLKKITTAADYVLYLRKVPEEVELLYQDLLISVTSFFREPDLYQTLTTKIFPEILKSRHAAEAIRIWIPACASGEEACSIAISLFEYLGDRALITPIQIFATDLSEIAIQKARTGIYSKAILQNVSPQRLTKFFVKTDHSYQIIKPIRDICIYATHNLLTDPPFSRMDIISCQNVMIYLGTKAQHDILQSFHYALKPNGYLMLGKSEGVSNASDLFIQSEKGVRVFTKTSNSPNLKFEFSPKISTHQNSLVENKITHGDLKNETDIGKEADKLLLARFIPPAVLINSDFHIIRFFGDTSNYLQPASGKASLHILKMVKDEIVFELRSLLNKAKKNSIIVRHDSIPVSINGVPAQVSIEIIPIKGLLEYFLIVFKEKIIVSVPLIKGKGKDVANEFMENRINQLEFQLRESKEHLKIMTDEFDFIQEQLQSANEEVLSSNEELQSINEELETSKEELQSTNEELTTINEEVQRRNEELSQSVTYAEAIVETIREPLLVLNSDMHIETVNKAFLQLFKRNPEEIIGQFFFSVSQGLWDIKELKDKLKEIISLNKSFENFELTHYFDEAGEMILSFNAMRLNQENKDKPKYLIVIEDITERKHSEELLKTNEERLRLLIQNAFDIITIFAENGDIIYESESIEEILGYTPAERIAKNIFIDSIAHPDDKHLKEKMFKNALANPGKDIRSEFRLMHKDGSYRIMEAICINLLNDFKIKGIIANYRDVTERRMLERQKEQFIGIASHELKTPVTSIKGYVQILQQMFSEDENKVTLEMLQKMDAQINRLTNLIKDLLDVTQIGEGLLKLKKEDFDITTLIDEVISEIKPTTSKHVIVNTLKGTVIINADKEKIRQALVNLISNAIKYSPAADRVIIRSEIGEEQITISVEDFGIGMSAETQSKIFKRFYRDTDPAINTFPGLGLGLFITAEIIKNHKGKIWVKSTKNVGSEFYFSLPLNNK